MKVGCQFCGTLGSGNFCGTCGNILPTFQLDYFSLLGFPCKILLDVDALKHNFYLLSKRLHPDKHQTSNDSIKETAIQKSILVNKAYNTLRDKFQRIRYLISLQLGFNDQNKETTMSIPVDLFTAAENVNKLIFALREELQPSKGRGSEVASGLQSAIEEIRQEIKRRETTIDELAKKWDASVDLEATQQIDSNQKLNLLKEIKKKMDEMTYCERMLDRINKIFEEQFYKRV